MKTLIIILLIILCGNAFALDPFDFSISAEFGIIPRGHLKLYESSIDIYSNMSFYSNIYSEFSFINNILFIGINSKIYIWKVDDSYDFNPDCINFMFSTGLRFNFLEIGFRHYCDHPIVAWIEEFYISPIYEQWYEEIYIKFSFTSIQ